MARETDLGGSSRMQSLLIVVGLRSEARIAARYGPVAVDMESHAVARVAAQHQIPFVVLRTVSDAAGHALPRAAQAGFKADGEPDVAAVLRGLARRPWELPSLLLTAANAARALRAL